MPHVYRHIRLDTYMPFYIGIGLDDIPKRAYEVGKRRSEFWNRIANKHGYEVDILFENIPIDLAKEKEKEFIALYGRIDLGTGTLCNLTDGGDGCNGWKATEETLVKMRAASIYRPLPPQTPEVKAKRAASLRGKKRTEEQRKNISKALKGKPQPREAVEKMTATVRLPHNIEKRRNQKSCKKVICLESSIVYRSAAEAGRQLNMCRSAISQCCLGTRKKAKSFTFKFHNK
jgi:hypothetical protein